MDTRLKVLLHGDTLVMAGVHAGLAAYPTLDVMQDSCVDVELPMLHELHPDVLILERDVMTPTALAALAEALPNMLLVSIDVEHGRILLWSDRRLRQFSLADFVRLIVGYAVAGAATEMSVVGGGSH